MYLKALGIKPEMTVLDLCCGDGYFTARLAKMVGGKVYTLDLDCQMIEVAKAEVARFSASVRQWICADAMALAACWSTNTQTSASSESPAPLWAAREEL